MLRPGLVSVTFRQLTPVEIIAACVQAGLRGIEWGGDVHVPHGNVEVAHSVGEATRAAGLEVACYGSYYRCDGKTPVPFRDVLDTALALGAPTIRVWAGQKGTDAATGDDWQLVTADLRRISELAAAEGVRIATEYHGQTLTDTRATTRRLINEVDDPNYYSLWQPLRRSIGEDCAQENLDDLEDVIPELAHVHVYEWADIEGGKREQRPLDPGGQWTKYVERLKQLDGNRWLLLEFVPGNDPAVLAREAATLMELCA